MIYVLDTDVFTLAETTDSEEYRLLHIPISQLPREDEVATTIITYEEQTRGWLAFAARSPAPEHQINAYRKLKKHLLSYLGWTILDFDAAAVAEFQRLKSLGLRVGTFDLKIASIVLARDGALLTRNLKDFTRIPGLRTFDWTRP